MKLKVAIFPGTFNPWHRGHTAVLLAACKAFDQVIIAAMSNPGKAKSKARIPKIVQERLKDQVMVVRYAGLLRDLVHKIKPDAVIRGLRTSVDFEQERTNQYWNEDLGVDVPTFYVITPRDLVHVSSSALRTVEELTRGSK